MKFFFTTGFTTAGTGTEVSSLTVKDAIQKMIREEEASAPLKDQQIVTPSRPSASTSPAGPLQNTVKSSGSRRRACGKNGMSSAALHASTAGHRLHLPT